MVHALASRRAFASFLPCAPLGPSNVLTIVSARASTADCWMRLRQLSDIPRNGRKLFSGNLTTRNSLLLEFRNYVRQGQSYWDAGCRTDGSAAALLFYYGALNLAKAELLRTNPTEILKTKIAHGLIHKHGPSKSIRGDYLEVVPGVFPLLYEKRTGVPISIGTKIPVVNLLSLLPDVGYEMHNFGRSRPTSISGFHAVAGNSTHAWSSFVTMGSVTSKRTETLSKLVNAHYERVALSSWPDWKRTFALSERLPSTWVEVYQSKKTHTVNFPGGTKSPDFVGARREMRSLLNLHVSEPINNAGDFYMTDTLEKSSPLIIPLDLARYATIFYLSSVVRYKPAALDPIKNGIQAWLMDAVSRDVPLNLLVGALMGITGEKYQFESLGYRV